MTPWHNYIIIATFEGLKQPQGLKQKLLVSGAAPVQHFENCFILFQVVSNCFKYFKLFQIVITSGQQPASHPMIVICLINKVGSQFST